MDPFVDARDTSGRWSQNVLATRGVRGGSKRIPDIFYTWNGADVPIETDGEKSASMIEADTRAGIYEPTDL